MPQKYNPLTTIDIWDAIPLTDLSATAKRIVIADWLNRGLAPSTVPKLTARERGRMRKIMAEEGIEVLQDALLYIQELEAEVRKQRGIIQVLRR